MFAQRWDPKANLTATQIMIQLNPWKEWSINSNLIGRSHKLNKSLNIYTDEPKFPWIAYRNDIRIPFQGLINGLTNFQSTSLPYKTNKFGLSSITLLSIRVNFNL